MASGCVGCGPRLQPQSVEVPAVAAPMIFYSSGPTLDYEVEEFENWIPRLRKKLVPHPLTFPKLRRNGLIRFKL